MLLNVDSGLLSTASAIVRLAGLKRKERPENVFWFEKRGIHLSEKKWRNHFRVSKTVFSHVLDQIAGHSLFKTHRAGRRAIDIGKQLAIFLYRVGGSHPGVLKISEKFEVSTSTVVHVTKRVALAIKDCFGHNVRLPTGGAEKKNMTQGFTGRQYNGGYVVIDCTGVEVVPSTKTTRAGLRHVHRGKDKGLAIRFQVACDMDGRIRHIWGGNPAAVHDMDLFKSSPLYTRMKEYLTEQEFYIGDAGYTLRPYMMTPYSTAEMKKVEKSVANAWVFFNRHFSAVRIVIERVFGILKARFRSLLVGMWFRDVTMYPLIFEVCCYLHNVCLDFREAWDAPAVRRATRENKRQKKAWRKAMKKIPRLNKNVGGTLEQGRARRKEVCKAATGFTED
jgi:hypothetical protein